MPVYRIRNWQKIYEVSDAKRTAPGRALTWIAIPTKHDGRGFRRLMRREQGDGMAIFAAFILMVEVAAKLPERGTLKDDDGALNALDLADKTGGAREVFDKALQVLSDKELAINWLEILTDTSEYPEVAPLRTDGRTGRDGQDETRRNETDVSASAAARPKRPAKRPNPHHQELIDFFTTHWRQKYQAEYAFQGGKDGAHIAWILKTLNGNLDRAKSIVEAYLSDDDPFNIRTRHSIGVLKSQFARYAVPEPDSARGTGNGAYDLDLHEPTPEQIAIAIGKSKP